MNPALHLLPVGVAAMVWYAFARLNRGTEWFRLGELIFWDAVILVLIFLLWLRWY